MTQLNIVKETESLYRFEPYTPDPDGWLSFNDGKRLPPSESTTEERQLELKTWRRRYQLKKQYDLTEREYDELFLKQKGLCAICQKPERKLGVDHNHVTGVIRGLLCNTCNRGIGFLGDSVALLKVAVRYLEEEPYE